MAAAPADFRPKTIAKTKQPRGDGAASPSSSRPRPDILAFRSSVQRAVSWWASRSRRGNGPGASAGRNCKDKSLDFVVLKRCAGAPVQGSRLRTNRVTGAVQGRQGQLDLPLLPKRDVADPNPRRGGRSLVNDGRALALAYLKTATDARGGCGDPHRKRRGAGSREPAKWRPLRPVAPAAPAPSSPAPCSRPLLRSSAGDLFAADPVQHKRRASPRFRDARGRVHQVQAVRRPETNTVPGEGACRRATRSWSGRGRGRTEDETGRAVRGQGPASLLTKILEAIDFPAGNGSSFVMW